MCARGSPRQATGPSRLLELDMGPKFAGVCSNGLENFDFLEVGGVRVFIFIFLAERASCRLKLVKIFTQRARSKIEGQIF